jgi:hypothetical protein
MGCKNVGTLDRMIRIVIGLLLISLVFTGPETMWGWLGLPLAHQRLVRLVRGLQPDEGRHLPQKQITQTDCRGRLNAFRRPILMGA